MISRITHSAVVGVMLLLGATTTASAVEWPPRLHQDIDVQPIKWDWQLIAPAVLSDDPTIDVYDIDMFINETSGVVGELKSYGKKVVCYVNFGAWEDWRDDAAAYPISILGNDYDRFPGEKWFDIRDVNPAKSKTGMALASLLEARIDRALQMGCDAIEPDNIDGFDDSSHNPSGFPLSYEDQIFFNLWAAKEVHERGMAIALKNNTNQALDPRMVDAFDFVVTESCIYFNECHYFDGFLDAGKPVFLTEYLLKPEDFCVDAKEKRISAIHKKFSLGSFRQGCDSYYDSGYVPETETEDTDTQPNPATNLLTNGGFESGLVGWTSCGNVNNLSNSTNISDGDNAIEFVGNAGCMYQEVSVTPGNEYKLSCDANQSGSDWTVIELSFSNNQYTRLTTESEQVTTSGSYSSYTLSGIAPTSTAYAVALIYSEDRLLLDNCSLSDITETVPTTDIETETETTPIALVDNLLTNGGFELDLNGWLSCGNSDQLSVSENSSQGDKALEIGPAAGCLYQEVPVKVSTSYSLSCDAMRTGTQWSIMQLSYIDSQYKSLDTQIRQIRTDGDYSTYSLQGSAPANSAFAVALLYSEDRTLVDNCTLVPN